MAVKNRRVFELRLGKLGLTLFAAGMSLMLFGIFLFGVFVGKQMEAYPERFTSGITGIVTDRWFASSAPVTGKAEPPPAPEPEKPGRVEHAAAGEDVPAPAGIDLQGGGSEGAVVGTLKEGPPEAHDRQPPVAGADAAPRNPQTVPGVLPGPVAASSPAAEVNRKRDSGATAGETKPEKTAKAAAESRSKERFEVQVAAYREKRSADQMAQKFGSFGFSPQVVMKEFPDSGRWFRVVVGGFESREAAQKAADQMAGKIRGLKCVIRPSERNGNGG
jgi:cell division septation protein DedD